MRGLRLAIGFALGWLTAVFFASPAEAEKRVALVIGNAAYAHADRLANPEADAAAMAALFTRLGFETLQAKTNLSLSAMKRALADFELAAKGSDIAVIYYSGHGVQIGGQDYLVPIDAELAREVDVPDETVPLERALRAISGASRLRLLIVDACRDNPFNAWSGHKGLTRGLAPPPDVTGLASTLIAFAASPGEQAVDGPSGGNSPFAASLLRRLPTPGLDIELALRLVTRDVYEATQGRQTPYKAGSLIGQTLPLVEGSAPEPGADLSALAVAQLCAVALDAGHGEWDVRPALRAFVEEAKRRGLAPADCKPAAPAPTTELSELSVGVLCHDALNASGDDWDSGPAFAAKVAEARRRGLDVESCRASEGSRPAPNADLSALAAAQLCTVAWDAEHGEWDARPALQAFVEEARRRGLSQADCAPATPTAEDSELSASVLCHDALNESGDDWDKRDAFAGKVAEARRRGLDVESCRKALASDTAAAAPQPAATSTNGEQQLIATYQSWNVYAQFVGKAKVCFALTQPTRRESTANPAYLFVSNRPAERVFDEISVIPGADIGGGTPIASIDGVAYPMIARGGHIWARNLGSEHAFVAAMRVGSTLTITARTKSGAGLKDEYPLSGVSQAIDRAAAECGR